jgi:hypothetical protein
MPLAQAAQGVAPTCAHETSLHPQIQCEHIRERARKRSPDLNRSTWVTLHPGGDDGGRPQAFHIDAHREIPFAIFSALALWAFGRLFGSETISFDE